MITVITAAVLGVGGFAIDYQMTHHANAQKIPGILIAQSLTDYDVREMQLDRSVESAWDKYQKYRDDADLKRDYEKKQKRYDRHLEKKRPISPN